MKINELLTIRIMEDKILRSFFKKLWFLLFKIIHSIKLNLIPHYHEKFQFFS